MGGGEDEAGDEDPQQPELRRSPRDEDEGWNNCQVSRFDLKTEGDCV